MSTSKRFDEIKVLDRMPSPSGVALELMRLTKDSDARINDIVHLIQSDPALAGRLLKFANSPTFGTNRPVAAISEAAIRLGLNVVSQLSLGLSILPNGNRGRCRTFDYANFWSRSMATALAARAIAAYDTTVGSEEAYTCGLLSSIGRLALASIYPDDYAEILSKSPNRETLLSMENAKFATTHVELTSAMLTDWGLPQLQITAIAAQNDEEIFELLNSSRAKRLARQLEFADQIALLCQTETSQRKSILLGIQRLANQIGLHKESLLRLIDSVIQQWQGWSKLLDIPNQGLPSMVQVEKELNSNNQDSEKTENTLSKLKILVIDDDLLTVKRLSALLESAGHSVLAANEGKRGLKIAMEENPHLIITDWQMPIMDGIEFCQALRKTRFGRQFYIIMLTACEEDHELVQAFEAGADDYIVKPFSVKALEARVRASQRLVVLQEEVETEREENRHFTAELAVANRRLEKMAMTDQLTQLPNRRYAMLRLEEAWADSQRKNQPMVCMIIDLDHFKQINDNYGHDMGDLVLTEVAQALQTSGRATDVIGRLGGEEFIVVSSNMNYPEAYPLAERMRKAVANCKIGIPNFRSHLTVSIGVAASDPNIPSTRVLLSNADKALYAAKNQGRNKVLLFQSQIPIPHEVS